MQFQLKTMLMAVSSATMMLAATGCATMDMGSSKAKTEATGSAGGGNAVNAINHSVLWPWLKTPMQIGTDN